MPSKTSPPAKLEFPLLPEMFTNVLPPMIPPMEWKSGFVTDFLHNWKLKRMEISTARQANIATNQHIIAQERLGMMSDFITWQAKVADIFSDLEHKRETRKAEIVEKNFKNQILYYEAENARMEFERRKRDYEAEARP